MSQLGPTNRRTLGGARMPEMMYGCAWKKDKTADLVYQAIETGFRGIDTAAMRRHYDEKLTGDGIRRAIADGLVTRSDLYTKFTPADDAFADAARYPSIAAQVRASVAASLANLATADDPDGEPYLDSLVMHSPYPSTDDTLAAWSALAEYVPDRVRVLGISHITLPLLSTLLATNPRVAIVQNRFIAREAHFHAAVRAACRAHGVAFQAFWTLTGNRDVWPTAPCVNAVATAACVEAPVAWYALIAAAGVVLLNGTTRQAHMRDDLDGLRTVRAWREGSEQGRSIWERAFGEFNAFVGGFGRGHEEEEEEQGG
ncbi:hypothetical protein P8C59_004327 [Phyllachora maydis]|uniref:NADP-dependent oxidoreductase domain-containing protein n=1 Tax=Phyllachora maydis TaxID=1825666 RepID=A0AAD9I2C8_9PEZI|nr:hypothetical protein P8C59_004327 [Phyllachora maydis]